MSRRNPFRGLVDHMSEMNRMRNFDEYGYAIEEGTQRTHATAWIPTTDVFAKGEDLIIRCELAGVNLEDVEITLSERTLTISGERRSDFEEEEAVSFYSHESSYGNFRRSMTLPEGVADNDVSASLNQGILHVRIRRGADTAPPSRSIRVEG